MASSSLSRLDYVFQNLIFLMLAPNKTSSSPLKNNGVLLWVKKCFWTIVEIKIFKPNNHFKALDN